MGRVEDDRAGSVDGLGLSAVHDVRRQEPEAGMAMMGVVGVEELAAERPGVLLGGEGAGEARAVL